MVKNANFLSFIREKNTKLVLQILKLQMNIGVQPEQMKMENMLEEVDIMDSVIKVVHSLDKNHNDNKEIKKINMESAYFYKNFI